MNKDLFRTLSEKSKIENIINFGEIINEIEEEDIYTSLFLVGNFYVEIFLNKYSNEIDSIVIQDNPDVLYKYLDILEVEKFITIYPLN